MEISKEVAAFTAIGDGHASSRDGAIRRKPPLQRKGIAINDDPALEQEADRMGAMAVASDGALRSAAGNPQPATMTQRVVQRVAFKTYNGQKDTKDYDWEGLTALAKDLEDWLDIQGLNALCKALEKPTLNEPLRVTDAERLEFIEKLKRSAIKDTEDTLKEIEGQFHELEEAGVDGQSMRMVVGQFWERFTNDSLTAALNLLEDYKDMMLVAAKGDSMKNALLDANKLEREAGAGSDAKQNLANARLVTGQGQVDTWSVSGASAKKMAKPQNVQEDADLDRMWDEWNGVGKGRYHQKAVSFFGKNKVELEHSREMDSEMQILDHLLNQILGNTENTNDWGDDAKFDAAFPPLQRALVVGRLYIHSDRTPCLSCGTVVDIFRQDFPRIQVMLSFARNYGVLSKHYAAAAAHVEEQEMALAMVDGKALNPLADTDAAYWKKKHEAEAKQKELEAYAKEAELKRAQVSKGQVKAATDMKLEAAKSFLATFLASSKCKAAEKEKYDQFFAPANRASNLNLLLKDIMAAGNEQAKLQAIRARLK